MKPVIACTSSLTAPQALAMSRSVASANTFMPIVRMPVSSAGNEHLVGGGDPIGVGVGREVLSPATTDDV